MTNTKTEMEKQLRLLEEEQMRVKLFMNAASFNCTTAPWIIARKYRTELKEHISILKENLAEME